MKRDIISVLLGLLAVASCPAQQTQDTKAATDLIARMSVAYQDMRSSLMMRGELVRRKSPGERVQETKRAYRLIQGDTGLRADVCDNSRPGTCSTYILRGEEVLMYFSLSNEFTLLAKAEPGAAAIQAALGAIQIIFYSRFADLAATNYAVTSVKEADLKINGKTKTCYRIKLKPAEGESRRWSGELWIDRESAFVWRAGLTKEDREAEFPLIEETVTWSEIARGKDVPIDELAWTPPAGAKRLTRIPSALPQ
jgi:hypothetical protein